MSWHLRFAPVLKKVASALVARMETTAKPNLLDGFANFLGWRIGRLRSARAILVRHVCDASAHYHDAQNTRE
jgi:hypothetical protein